jgi:hypothetical protein
MSSKKDIKDLFVTELLNTPEYKIVLAIKQKIVSEILAPSVKEQISYDFETEQSEEQQSNIKMCMIVEFGFFTNNISGNSVVIDMKQFL